MPANEAQEQGMATQPQPAEGVARLGYRALAAGRPVIVTGFSNRLLAVLGRFAPHWVSLRVAELLMSAE